MGERIRVITATIKAPVNPGERFEIPIEISPGKTAEIMGVRFYAAALNGGTSGTCSMGIFVWGKHVSVNLMHALSDVAENKGRIDLSHFPDDAEYGDAYGRETIVGTKVQGTQLHFAYKNGSDAGVQQTDVTCELLVREY